MKNGIVLLLGFVILHSTRAQAQGIINTANSPHVTLKSIDIGDCQWTEGFWADKFRICSGQALPANYYLEAA